MSGWDVGILLVIFIGMAIVVILYGFLAQYIGDEMFEAAMPDLHVNTTCIDPSFEGWGSTYNQPLCEVCKVKWYFWCVVGEI